MRLPAHDCLFFVGVLVRHGYALRLTASAAPKLPLASLCRECPCRVISAEACRTRSPVRLQPFTP
jgi:hypothetical protein